MIGTHHTEFSVFFPGPQEITLALAHEFSPRGHCLLQDSSCYLTTPLPPRHHAPPPLRRPRITPLKTRLPFSSSSLSTSLSAPTRVCIYIRHWHMVHYSSCLHGIVCTPNLGPKGGPKTSQRHAPRAGCALVEPGFAQCKTSGPPRMGSGLARNCNKI